MIRLLPKAKPQPMPRYRLADASKFLSFFDHQITRSPDHRILSKPPSSRTMKAIGPTFDRLLY